MNESVLSELSIYLRVLGGAPASRVPRTLRIVCGFLLAAAGAYSQTPLTNLNFELATTVPIPGDPYQRLVFSNAFPYWTGYCGAVQQDSALFNNIFLDSAGIALVGTNFGQPYFGGLVKGQ